MARAKAVIGVSDHAGWAVLVTVASGGVVLDRRRVALVDADLPCLPHHHDAQGLPRQEGVALVERVHASARRHARRCLDALAGDLAATITGVALRRCPPLPPTIAERIADYRAQCVADTVMFRDALAEAAAARGWAVSWYDVKTVFDAAARALERDRVDGLVRAAGKALGPPWQQDHRVAMAAAIAAADPGR
jgi:hypothetical protein